MQRPLDGAGADIYLGPDSADYQLISAFAAKVYDTRLFGGLRGLIEGL